MRILQLTPGTGNFYCGSCLRDQALVRALRARHHDVLMVPLYLPVVTDGPDASAGVPIFLSGLSIFLQQKIGPLRNMPDWLDHLLSAPALLRAAARLAGLTSARDLGESAVSMLQGEQGHQARELTRLVVWLRTQPAPDVICLSNSLLSGLVGPLREQFPVPIVCSWQGEDSFLDALPAPYRQQSWDLLAQRCAAIDRFVAPSRSHAEPMRQRLGLAADRVVVVPNGIDLDGFEPAPSMPVPPTIGYLARLHPAKGLTTLIEAFVQLKQRDRVKGLRLRIAGAETPADSRYVRQLEKRLAACGLRQQVDFLPNLNRAEKQAFLQTLSVFSVPASASEAFGLYVLEALAAGVPIAQPRHGAFPELLAMTGGGVLCAPDDPQALADAVEVLLLDPARARELGAQGRAAVAAKFSVAEMARQFETVLAGELSRRDRSPPPSDSPH